MKLSPNELAKQLEAAHELFHQALVRIGEYSVLIEFINAKDWSSRLHKFNEDQQLYSIDPEWSEMEVGQLIYWASYFQNRSAVQCIKDDAMKLLSAMGCDDVDLDWDIDLINCIPRDAELIFES